MTLFLSASLVIMLPNNYLLAIGTFKVGKFYFYSRVLFLTQNFIRSCVIHSIFFPTHSYMFFQWKTFQMRIQDFRFFIPPNFPLKEKHPSRSSRNRWLSWRKSVQVWWSKASCTKNFASAFEFCFYCWLLS